MKCWKTKKQISAALDGELTRPEEMLLTEHLEQCRACRSDWELLKLGANALSAMRSIQPPWDFRAKLARFIESETRKQFNLWTQFNETAKSLIPAFAALMLIILSLVIALQTLQDPRARERDPEQAIFTTTGDEEPLLLAGGDITSDQVLRSVLRENRRK